MAAASAQAAVATYLSWKEAVARIKYVRMVIRARFKEVRPLGVHFTAWKEGVRDAARLREARWGKEPLVRVVGLVNAPALADPSSSSSASSGGEPLTPGDHQEGTEEEKAAVEQKGIADDPFYFTERKRNSRTIRSTNQSNNYNNSSSSSSSSSGNESTTSSINNSHTNRD